MPMTEAAARKLAAFLNQLTIDDPRRGRTWDERGILKTLERVAGLDQFAIAHAAINAAEDLDADTPGVLASPDSLHWGGPRASTRAPRNPLPHEECPEHPGQFRLSCSSRPPCGPPKAQAQRRHEHAPAPALDDVRAQLQAATTQIRAKERDA